MVVSHDRALLDAATRLDQTLATCNGAFMGTHTGWPMLIKLVHAHVRTYAARKD